MLERCPACRGKKEVMGAGMIYHKCKTCLGVGHIEPSSPEPIIENVEIENVPRRTYKRKVKNNENQMCDQV